jgi:hypothetical protein
MSQDEFRRYLDRVIAQGGDLQPPCSEQGIRELRIRVRNELSAEISDDYADFLRITDGLNFNGVFVYPSRTIPIVGARNIEMDGLVEENLIWREAVDPQGDWLFYADSDINLWGYNYRRSRYELRPKDCDDVEEVYGSFDEMLIATLRYSVES